MCIKKKQKITCSYLSASIWSRFGTLEAGKMPNNTPANPEKPSARPMDHSGMLDARKEGMLLEMRVPRP